jgi:effector-binding domain-containing protein
VRERVAAADAMAWWVDTFTRLHRETHGSRRTGADGVVFPQEFFTDEAAELTAFVPVEEGPELFAARELAVTVHTGPLTDLDGAYGALGQRVAEAALRSDGPVWERYLPLGAESDLLNHHTEVGWAVAAAS